MLRLVRRCVILSTLLLSAGLLAGVAEFLLLLFGMDAASELTVGDFRGVGWGGIVEKWWWWEKERPLNEAQIRTNPESGAKLALFY